MIIADEVDSQLKQAMASYIGPRQLGSTLNKLTAAQEAEFRQSSRIARADFSKIDKPMQRQAK